MKASGPKHERETIIRWDEETDNVSVWTASETIYRQLKKRLGMAHLTDDGERHACFEFPRRFMVLPRAREKRPMSQGLKAALDRRKASRVKSFEQETQS
jgi:hypothetical protein